MTLTASADDCCACAVEAANDACEFCSAAFCVAWSLASACLSAFIAVVDGPALVLDDVLAVVGVAAEGEDDATESLTVCGTPSCAETVPVELTLAPPALTVVTLVIVGLLDVWPVGGVTAVELVVTVV